MARDCPGTRTEDIAPRRAAIPLPGGGVITGTLTGTVTRTARGCADAGTCRCGCHYCRYGGHCGQHGDGCHHHCMR